MPSIFLGTLDIIYITKKIILLYLTLKQKAKKSRYKINVKSDCLNGIIFLINVK